MGMGRRSSDGGGGGAATVMGLRMVQCGRQTVPVVQPDGQVRQFGVPIKVADLLQLYPHNFVSYAAGPGGGVKRSSGILPLDAYLETGSLYVLLPLPKLFPSAPPSTPHFCSCYFSSNEGSAGIGGAIKAELMRHLPAVVGGGGGGGASSSKISPEDGGGVSGSQSSSAPPLPRRLWEPALEIISEDRVLVIPPTPAPAVAATCEKEIAAEKKQSENKGKKLVSAALNNMKLR